MSESAAHEHPSPHRERVGAAGLLIALWIGPAAWASQLMIDYGLASYSCFPSDAPRATAPTSAWYPERLVLVGVNILCLMLAVAGVGVAYRSWRAIRDEKPGAHQRLLDAGEGRSRFLAACGVFAGLVFSLAILFHLAAIAGVPACWSFGP